jgi:hypothetical protein
MKTAVFISRISLYIQSYIAHLKEKRNSTTGAAMMYRPQCADNKVGQILGQVIK